MAGHSKLVVLDAKVSFPASEVEILKYWDEIKAFEQQLELSKDNPPFTFYDGPPFATGLPHYGHILAGTIKDVVTRYASQTGHYVSRRFGWDCHGLPVEYEIDKTMNITSKQDVLKMGVDKYNEACRGIVLRYTAEWEDIVKRAGRWIDFQNGYRTMDLKFMESVWWVFKQIYDKGYVYRGYKVMPYSTALTTPLSNFEANLNYKEADDPAIVVTFPVVGDEQKAAFVAWTTTPWTLFSNLALCVNPDLTYVRVRDLASGNIYIMAKPCLGALYTVPKINYGHNQNKDTVSKEEGQRIRAEWVANLPQKTEQYEILSEVKGSELVGTKYEPIFPHFAEKWQDTAFRVIADSFVTDDSGTGIVHCAPAFGEDDHRVCVANGVIAKDGVAPCPIDEGGNFTDEVSELTGTFVKAADPSIIAALKARQRLVKAGTIRHSYPFCWRSETPLLYRTIPSWFVRVEALKERLIENTKQTRWVPSAVGEHRFANWLRDARDWSISRNRYWGTPLPIWMSEDGESRVVVGSVEELERLSGVTGITDIHKHKIDHITIPDPRGPEYPPLRRVEEVFDCWFESGSMPYAQLHYPFENKEVLEKGFPADFIAEGLDQTRGWFYTLMVLSTALFDQPPFKNVIVNGLVLAADGKKMSKRLKNYPDPVDIFNQNGADALRLYLINSPVVRAEPLAFKQEGVVQIVKTVLLPWWNAFRFCLENIIRWNESEECRTEYGGVPFKCDFNSLKPTNVMDKWILAELQTLIKEVRTEMEAYRLYTVVPILLRFLEQLTNWYVRGNRRRFKGVDTTSADRLEALSTLAYVLHCVNKLMAPITPFVTEMMYQHMKLVLPEEEQGQSVHFLQIPEARMDLIDEEVLSAVRTMQNFVELGRVCRKVPKVVPLKMPVKRVTVLSENPSLVDKVQSLEEYVREELNVRDIVYVRGNVSEYVNVVVSPNRALLGPQLGKDLNLVAEALKSYNMEQVSKFMAEGQVEIEVRDPKDPAVVRKHVITVDKLSLSVTSAKSVDTVASGNGLIALMDTTPDKTLAIAGAAREFVNRVQRMRKTANLLPFDKVEIFYDLAPASEIPVNETEMLATLPLPQFAIDHNSAIQKARAALGLPTAAAPATLLQEETKEAKDSKGKKGAQKQKKQAAPAPSPVAAAGEDDDTPAIQVELDDIFTCEEGTEPLRTAFGALPTRGVPPKYAHVIISEVNTVGTSHVKFWLVQPFVIVNRKTVPRDKYNGVLAYLSTMPYEHVTEALSFKLDGQKVDLELGKDVFLTCAAAAQASAEW